MKPIRVVVIGAGRLGTFHAQLLASLEDVSLVAVADPVLAARERLAAKCQVVGVADYHELLGQFDAAIVATPTANHAEIAVDLLHNGIHILVEKPIASTTSQADQMLSAASHAGSVLQVGHVERFNPAFTAFDVAELAPRYFRAQRFGAYTCRSVDVGVVLDLMIHDLDLILSCVDAEVEQVEARGASVFGPHEDMAFAELYFADGTVASLQASRVSSQTIRQLDVWGEYGELHLDFAAHRASRSWFAPPLHQLACPVDQMSDSQKQDLRERLFSDYLPLEEIQVEPANAILQEQLDFVAAIRTGKPPRVTGRHGRDALALAERIVERLGQRPWTTRVQVSEPATLAPQPVPLPARRRAG